MSAINLQELALIRKAGLIRRFHTSYILREQNVAAHTWQALCILFAIEPTARHHVFISLLMHDVAEVATGDIPAPVKWASEEMTAILGRLEGDMHDTIGYTPPVLTPYETALVRYCDDMELVLTCYDECLLGNQYAHVMGMRKLKRVETICMPVLGTNAKAVSLYCTTKEIYDAQSKRYASSR